jgi:anti-sigma factor RsiW
MVGTHIGNASPQHKGGPTQPCREQDSSLDLPELQNSDFSLRGGRMTYLYQTPGAHLIYDARKHHISVFVFQERFLPARLTDRSLKPANLSFNMETWSQGGLRYFVIGDASAADIDGLARLFKTAS